MSQIHTVRSLPAYLSAGFCLQLATASRSRCQLHQPERSPESSHSRRIQSAKKKKKRKGNNLSLCRQFKCWPAGSSDAPLTFMSTRVQFWVAQAFSRISKMATVLRFMMSTSHWPMVSPDRENLASNSCSSDHWGSLLASSYSRNVKQRWIWCVGVLSEVYGVPYKGKALQMF